MIRNILNHSFIIGVGIIIFGLYGVTQSSASIPLTYDGTHNIIIESITLHQISYTAIIFGVFISAVTVYRCRNYSRAIQNNTTVTKP